MACARTSACRSSSSFAIPVGGDRARPRSSSRMVPGVPADAGAHRPDQPRAARADHRHPRRAGLRARAARRPSASTRPTTTSPTVVAAGRPADVVDVPDGQPAHQRVERRRAVARRQPRRQRARSRSARSSPTSRYLVQILMSVVMATFMISMIPRASVVGRPHPGGARHRAERRCRRPTRCATSSTHGALEFRDVGFHYPGAEQPVLDRHLVHDRGRPDHGDRRQHRRRQDDARQPRSRGCSTPPSGAVLVGGVDVRDLDPDVLWNRIGLVPQRPYLFSGTVASNLRVRQARRHRGRDVGGARGRPGRRLRAAHARRARGPHRAGRHQRVGRPAPAAVDRPGARAQARHLRVRRLVLGARPRHRRPAAGGAGAVHRATPRS